MTQIKLFISSVTNEFKRYRDALRKDLDRPDITVKIQEDFVAWGGETLEKLDEYIRQCDAVIHIVGDQTGSDPGELALSSMLTKYPDFAKQLVPIADIFMPGGPAIPYTQWEAYLAIYHRKPLIIATPSRGALKPKKNPARSTERAAQQAHLARLEKLGRYPEVVFDNADRLAVAILRSQLYDIINREQADPLSAIDREIRGFLASVTIPYQLIDAQKRFAIYRIIDPTSLFSNEFVLAVAESVPDASFIDSIVAISRRHSAFINIVLVAVNPLTREIAQYVEARGITIKSLFEFRDEFTNIATRERYYVGELAANNLCETLNIDRFYIEPDAAPVIPGDHVENSFLQTRIDAKSLIASFIKSDDKILFVFGGYGSGKSAFCAHILKQPVEFSTCTPIYYPLKQLETPNDLARVISKCQQLGKLYGGVNKTVLVILDGLDELPNAMQPDEKRMNMLRILEGAARGEKVMITARASYFRGLDDFWRLFNRKGDDNLWRDIARLMPTSGAFPKVSAIALREFDSEQIREFSVLFGRTFKSFEGPSQDFSRELFNEGTGPNYMMLARNPLYLYLLLGSRPWDNPNVGCLADVYGIFIRYWLERDIEKGKSRWNLTTDDRFEFMFYLAFVMFLNRRHALRFDEFDELVQSFFDRRLKRVELSALALDLQTTGAFGSIGNYIHFAVPAFSDYLVALRFKLGDFNLDGNEGEPPNRMPTIDQIIMWAGMAETQRKGIAYHEQLLLKNGIPMREEFAFSAMLDCYLALYQRSRDQMLFWEYLDEKTPDATGVRIVVNAVVLTAADSSGSTVLLKVLNKKGLHARACARLVQAYEIWREELGTQWAKPVLLIGREGPGEDRVPLNSLMGLMMLSASPGTMLIIHFENCSFGEVETLLERLRCERPTLSQKFWGARFGEEG
jgi:phosphotransferase system HPr-like phosphotransfer protein